MKAWLWLTTAAMLFCGAGVAISDTSPLTSDPESIAVAPDETCQLEPEKLKCRWAGECVRRQDSCLSCMEGYSYSDQLGTCYSCSEGSTLNAATLRCEEPGQ